MLLSASCIKSLSVELRRVSVSALIHIYLMLHMFMRRRLTFLLHKRNWKNVKLNKTNKQ